MQKSIIAILIAISAIFTFMFSTVSAQGLIMDDKAYAETSLAHFFDKGTKAPELKIVKFNNDFLVLGDSLGKGQWYPCDFSFSNWFPKKKVVVKAIHTYGGTAFALLYVDGLYHWGEFIQIGSQVGSFSDIRTDHWRNVIVQDNTPKQLKTTDGVTISPDGLNLHPVWYVCKASIDGSLVDLYALNKAVMLAYGAVSSYGNMNVLQGGGCLKDEEPAAVNLHKGEYPLK